MNPLSYYVRSVLSSKWLLTYDIYSLIRSGIQDDVIYFLDTGEKYFVLVLDDKLKKKLIRKYKHERLDIVNFVKDLYGIIAYMDSWGRFNVTWLFSKRDFYKFYDRLRKAAGYG